MGLYGPYAFIISWSLRNQLKTNRNGDNSHGIEEKFFNNYIELPPFGVNRPAEKIKDLNTILLESKGTAEITYKIICW